MTVIKKTTISEFSVLHRTCRISGQHIPRVSAHAALLPLSVTEERPGIRISIRLKAVETRIPGLLKLYLIPHKNSVKTVLKILWQLQTFDKTVRKNRVPVHRAAYKTASGYTY